MLEIIGRELLLVLVVDLPIGEAVVPLDVKDGGFLLGIHRQALEAVSDLDGDRLQSDTADLLEISELGDLHAVEPDFPAQAPGPEGGGLPVVLDEADVMFFGIDAD